MEDKFDNYLKRELDSIENAPVPSPVWDKDNTWKKIAIGLKPQAKMYSIKWLYAAASLVLIILLGTSVYHIKYNKQISQMKSENDRLTQLMTFNNKSSKQAENKQEKVITIFRTKETIKKEFVQNTIYVHDTVTVLGNSTEPGKEETVTTSAKTVNDSSVALLSKALVKKNKLYFVISNEPIEVQDEKRYLFVSSKSLLQTEQDTIRSSFPIRITLN